MKDIIVGIAGVVCSIAILLGMVYGVHQYVERSEYELESQCAEMHADLDEIYSDRVCNALINY